MLTATWLNTLTRDQQKSTLSVIKKKIRMGEVLEDNTGLSSSSLHLHRSSLLSRDKAVQTSEVLHSFC